MNKWLLLIGGIILVSIIEIRVKIKSDLNEIFDAFKSEHTLNEPSLYILSESISPNEKHKYYQYQFDKGGVGYSRVFWTVIENKENLYDLEKGIITSGYKILGWNNKSALILEK